MKIYIPCSEKEFNKKVKFCKENYKCVEVDYESKSITYKVPCLICGKYHHKGSKAEKRCMLKIVGSVSKVVRDD